LGFLTERGWQVIKNIVELQERSKENSLGEILNTIFYIIKSGCQWRMLPSDSDYGEYGEFPRLSRILADGGCQEDLSTWVKDKFGWELEVVLLGNES